MSLWCVKETTETVKQKNSSLCTRSADLELKQSNSALMKSNLDQEINEYECGQGVGIRF